MTTASMTRMPGFLLALAWLAGGTASAQVREPAALID